ncbi:MAG: PAS-domain containing protein [Marinibacterium sp.]|nr:PAS-domain containing protein [Marinibacterium sp.]
MKLTDHQIKSMTTGGLNLIAQALSIYDRDLCLVLSNSRFQEMFSLPDRLVEPGASFEESIRHLAVNGEYGPLEDIDNFVQSRVDQARAFAPHYMERVRSNGRTISVEGTPLPEGGWVTVYTDISRTKRSEALLRARSEELTGQLIAHAEELSAANRELAATNTALEEAKRQLTKIEARTRMTTEMLPAHIAHVDAHGRYTYSNLRLNSVLPGRDAEIVGLYIWDALGDFVYSRIQPHLEAAYAGKDDVFEFNENHSGRRIRVALTPDPQGGVYVMSMDVTEETQVRSALQQTRRRALAAQMTSGLAHDFSNLLTIILGLQSKLSAMELGADAAELIDATRATANRGGRLLNRIASMTGHRTLRPKPAKLSMMFSDLKILAGPSLPPNLGLTILDYSPDLALMLDAGMLQNALLNLILNARDACGLNGQIVVTAQAIEHTWIEIKVSDTGPGFSDWALQKAVEPFFTTKGGEGSGLGLPMVYDMVKLAGGNLQLSNTDIGGCVTLRLPYRQAPTSTGGLALLVEDSDDLRATFREMLMELDFSVIEAVSADEAAALAADLPDISMILSDLRLEGPGTGLDLLERLKGSERPAILMTSLSPSDPLVHRAQSQAPVLFKPFTRDDLAAFIRPEAAE